MWNFQNNVTAQFLKIIVAKFKFKCGKLLMSAPSVDFAGNNGNIASNESSKILFVLKVFNDTSHI